MLSSMTALYMIKILQGRVVTQTMLGGLTVYPEVAYFRYCTCAENYKSCMTADKAIAIIIIMIFLGYDDDLRYLIRQT